MPEQSPLNISRPPGYPAAVCDISSSFMDARDTLKKILNGVEEENLVPQKELSFNYSTCSFLNCLPHLTAATVSHLNKISCINL